MSFYDDEENPLLVRPRPFWEEEEEPIVPTAVIQPPTPPPAAPPPEVEGPGFASPEDIAAVPEVEGPGFASAQEIPGVEPPPPEVEGPGFASLEEIPGAGPEESFLGKAAKTGLAAAKMLLPNVGQAKAVLEPETALAARDVLKAVPDYWERIKGRWASGQEMAEDEVLKYDALSGKVPWEEIKDKAELSEALKLKAQEDEKQPWYYKGPLIAVEQVPMMLESLKEGGKRAIEWAMAGGTTAAVAGQLGPQAALPEELATVPAAAAISGSMGMTYGTAEYWRRQGSGSLYHELRKEGVPHEVAKNVGLTFGVPYAAVELLQMTKLVPGMKQAAAHAIAGSVKKKLVALGLEGVADVGENVAQELGQELLQAGHEGFAEWKAGVTPPPEKKGIFQRALDTIYNTAISVPFLRLPKTAVDAAKIIAQGDTTPVTAPAVTPPATVPTAPGVPPSIPPTPPEAFAPPGAVEVPGTVPGAEPGEVTIGPPPVTPPGAPAVPTGDERFAPPAARTPDIIEPGPATPAGEAVTQYVGKENIAVKQVADTQSQNLQAANAPKTAEAIQQVARQSNAEASVSAGEFLAQAKQKVADEAAEAAEKAAAAAPAAVQAPTAVTPAMPAVQAAAPAIAPVPALPTEQAPAAPPVAPASAVVVGGQVFTGETHEDAVRAAYGAVGGDAMRSASGGWVDPDTGRFVSHEIFEAHRDLNAAIEQAGGDTNHPSVQQAGAQLAEAQARDEELNNQIVQPGGEQVVQPGIKGQEALVSIRPSQELAVPLAGVNVAVEGVTPEGRTTTAQRPAAQALNDARNDRTAFTLLLDCLH